MITRMTLEEKKNLKTMVENLSKRWAKRLGISEEALSEVLEGATKEIYQEYPYTTAIIKKTVGGKQIRGAGFMKYNLNDLKLAKKNPKYGWNESKGKFMALSRAYSSFIESMAEEQVLGSLVNRQTVTSITVQATVEETEIPVAVAN